MINYYSRDKKNITSKPILLFLLFLTLNSSICIASPVVIIGRINNIKINTVRVGLYINNITITPKNFISKVERNGKFKIVCDIIKPVYGFIDLNGSIFHVFLIPNHILTILLINDKLDFRGSLMHENEFLNRAANDKLWNYSDFNLSQTPDSNYHLMGGRRLHLAEILAESNKRYNLSPAFISFFKWEDDCRFNKFIVDFNFGYASERKLAVDDTIFKKYKHSIHNFINDQYLTVPSYLTNLQSYTFRAPDIFRFARLNGLTMEQGRLKYIMDSLSGKTRDYLLANEIFIDLKYKVHRDSLLINNFKRIAKDAFTINVVQNLIDGYQRLSSFENRPISAQVKSTQLVSSKGKQITFKQLLALHKGSVLYIDLYGYYCPPCRAEVPFFLALKKRYKFSEVTFINITPDSYKSIKWNKYFIASGTKENQYKLKKGFQAQLLKQYEINGTPDYILIDKLGNLVTYNAPRPSDENKISAILDQLLL